MRENPGNKEIISLHQLYDMSRQNSSLHRTKPNIVAISDADSRHDDIVAILYTIGQID